MCNTCKSGYYLCSDNGKYYECIGCSICNNDGTFKTYCNSEYYKGNDNRCYKCIDRCNECSDNGESCNTCNPEYSLIDNKCICNKETSSCPKKYIGKGCNKYDIFYYYSNENINEWIYDENCKYFRYSWKI